MTTTTKDLFPGLSKSKKDLFTNEELDYFKPESSPVKDTLNCPICKTPCEESEQESLKILRNGMNQGQQVSAIMTVSKASNAVFRNLIMIKPVFSSKRKYIYTASSHSV